ncbi:MAG TPA: pentapeptide repeat-containing protein [Ktedonobacteraceae bacterium]
MSQQQPDPTRPGSLQATVQSKTPPGTGSQPPEKVPARPAPDDREGWKTYWEACQQPWRTEPEIATRRQEELAERRKIVPDVKRGIYPLREMSLSRADIEWLLATHEHGRGPVDWSDVSQRGRKGLDLRGAQLQQVDLNNLPLACSQAGLVDTEWYEASREQRAQASVSLQGASLRKTHLEGASLSGACMQGADLYRAQLSEADLGRAQLKQADFYRAYLEGTNLGGAQLAGAILRGARLERTHLARVMLSDERQVGPQLADVQWESSTNLARVDWSQILILGDEELARQSRDDAGTKKSQRERLRNYQYAVRANRQLAVALQSQGLNEEAARFAYRANVLQRKVFWWQLIQPALSPRQRIRKLGSWVFSHLLSLVAGYGYKPERSLLVYLLVIFGFMGAYLLASQFAAPHLRWDEALVLSISSFHGRGFFTQTITLDDTYARLAVIEAVLGLFIEVSFIATFTQRFFGK